MIAEAGVPTVVHCGHGPLPGEFTGMPEVDRAHPYAEQLAAIAGGAEANERLGEPFPRSVVHDTPARLLDCAIHS